MSRETDLKVLLAQENLIVTAMMDVRYAVEAFEKPKQKDLNTIAEVGGRFTRLAVQIHEEAEKAEAERQAREYGDE
jgi:hypothetical protein